MTVYQKKSDSNLWTPKTLLILWGMVMVFILLLCLIGAWWLK